MLKLQNIKKVYKTVSGDVHALKGLTLNFRKNEFVSILGPSGCGKTTLLNIIGGLDKYSSGDLFINGKSTKEYKDGDWDSYRNHSIGFVFQSYNLIPHQSILGNVELALTIAGMSKEERVKKAKEALDKVGLSDQYYKKPNQLSGGQCQRVAIARSLVNEPDILLADEPTGALDTVTSVQIMELIKEIAKERLVIMVTHNPELAEKYSTRIIKLRDGLVIDDSNPYEGTTEVIVKEKAIVEKGKKPKKTKMSFFTAFRLSLQNLFTKKARTTMTAIAGAIGIIGVSAVLSVSNGIQTYVNDMQNDMLSGNPITIAEEALDLTSFMSSMTVSQKADVLKETGWVDVNSMMATLVERSKSMENMMVTNDITEQYIKYINNMPKDYKAIVSYKYGVNVTNNIYTGYRKDSTAQYTNMSLSSIQETYTSILNKTDYSQYSSYISSLSQAFAQAPGDDTYLLEQYNLLDGKVASGKNEIMIVVNKNRELNDLLLAQLGYYTQDEFANLIYKSGGADAHTTDLDKNQFSYEELMSKTFTWYPNDSVFTKNPSYNPEYYNFVEYNYNNIANDSFKDGEQLTVVGILEPKDDLSYGCLSSGFYYTEALTKHILDSNDQSEIVKNLRATNDKDGNPVTSYTSMNYQPKENLPSFDMGITYQISYNFENKDYTETKYLGSQNMMATFLKSYIDIPESYSLTLRELGGEPLPSSISIYSRNFDDKSLVLDYLNAWNKLDNEIFVDGDAVIDRSKVTYTDTLSLIISMISSFINIITIALVAFTSLSLIVSCVMIAIITYVSVVERVKEIGVIRSLGGRKKDVSHLFNAETFIIGLGSGLIGIFVTYLLTWGINLIVNHFAGIGTIAIFPISYAVIMVLISIFLNLISGFFPSKSAAKKDPVVALRTE